MIFFSGAATGGQYRAAGPIPVVIASVRQAAAERVRAEGQSRRGVPPGELQGAVPVAGAPLVRAAQPRQAAGAVAER